MTDAIRLIHPVWLRATHWLNALAVVILATSGWRIYNASPLFDFKFAKGITLAGNGLVYLLCNAGTGRLVRKFFPLSPRAIVADLRAALRGRLSHADPRQYNAAQRAAYLFVMVDAVLLVLSGLVLWKSVQFAQQRKLLGGYETARRVHFFAMAALVAFLAVHLALAALVPRRLLAMIRGR